MEQQDSGCLYWTGSSIQNYCAQLGENEDCFSDITVGCITSSKDLILKGQISKREPKKSVESTGFRTPLLDRLIDSKLLSYRLGENDDCISDITVGFISFSKMAKSEKRILCECWMDRIQDLSQ